MKADPNYPRMMFHRSKDPVTVYSEDQEASLGPQWSRKIIALPSREEKPAKVPDPEPEEEPEELPEWEEPEEEPAEPETVEAAAAPSAKPKKARPAAHRPPHKAAAHKRKG